MEAKRSGCIGSQSHLCFVLAAIRLFSVTIQKNRPSGIVEGLAAITGAALRILRPPTAVVGVHELRVIDRGFAGSIIFEFAGGFVVAVVLPVGFPRGFTPQRSRVESAREGIVRERIVGISADAAGRGKGPRRQPRKRHGLGRDDGFGHKGVCSRDRVCRASQQQDHPKQQVRPNCNHWCCHRPSREKFPVSRHFAKFVVSIRGLIGSIQRDNNESSIFCLSLYGFFATMCKSQAIRIRSLTTIM